MITEAEYIKGKTLTLNDAISKAMIRVSGKTESALCHFLPAEDGDRLHHFSLAKMRKEHPSELLALIKTHILDKDSPAALPTRTRSKGTKNEKGLFAVKFPRSKVSLLMELIKKSGDPELVSLFSFQETLPQIQKRMLKMIRAQEVDQGLWETYIRMISEKKAK
jgi:hypothetical protein